MRPYLIRNALICIHFKKQSKIRRTKHHDQIPSVQNTSVKEIHGLSCVTDALGNPFLEIKQDLLVLDNRDVADPSVANTVRIAEALGREQYDKFMEERLIKCPKPITDTIPKNKLPLFRSPPVKTQSKHKAQLVALRSDCSLFSRL